MKYTKLSNTIIYILRYRNSQQTPKWFTENNKANQDATREIRRLAATTTTTTAASNNIFSIYWFYWVISRRFTSPFSSAIVSRAHSISAQLFNAAKLFFWPSNSFPSLLCVAFVYVTHRKIVDWSNSHSSSMGTCHKSWWQRNMADMNFPSIHKIRVHCIFVIFVAKYVIFFPRFSFSSVHEMNVLVVVNITGQSNVNIAIGKRLLCTHRGLAKFRIRKVNVEGIRDNVTCCYARSSIEMLIFYTRRSFVRCQQRNNETLGKQLQCWTEIFVRS